ncbi:nickel/cobalt efflux system [Chitiniphilus shinanonensis]|uniref:Nickel/cobalt efflux system n=1 Tax=Chitiniphilus shinanonensis TaxID=553088 RepID=A0ABQ6BWG7_9NEIS|nr:nickel/cobalt efflux transporter [Chitiniphilus shinanonensis]GLS05772.1 nickel/cobalt efflux system [Chitiniphilus shinanonensis]
MYPFSTLLQQGNAWLFIPSAVLLGALHGLEPGHSKTMMAAFIVAVRGTVGQAVLLGLAATLSHTAVVWAVAMVGLHLGRNWDAATAEPYFQLASGVLIVAIALWMLWRTWRAQQAAEAAQGAVEPGRIDTGHGVVWLELTDDDAPRFRLRQQGKLGHHWLSRDVTVRIAHPDGEHWTFGFASRMGSLESAEPVPAPHAFEATLSLRHGDHAHDYAVRFVAGRRGAEPLRQAEYQDAHERAHAEQIQRRFAQRDVTTGQIVLFGLTGGLIPCPASITVLLLCLQLKQLTLGAALVLCFSVGLALTLVLSGSLAALGVRHASRRWQGFGDLARQAPYLSGALIVLVGLWVSYHGVAALV